MKKTYRTVIILVITVIVSIPLNFTVVLGAIKAETPVSVLEFIIYVFSMVVSYFAVEKITEDHIDGNKEVRIFFKKLKSHYSQVNTENLGHVEKAILDIARSDSKIPNDVISSILKVFSNKRNCTDELSNIYHLIDHIIENKNHKNQLLFQTLSEFKKIEILPQVKSYFDQSWCKLLNDISIIEQGVVLESDLKKQYQIASSVSDSYKETLLDNVFATSLDLPSEFFVGNPQYFESQRFLTTNNDNYLKFYNSEKEIYTSILSNTFNKDINNNKNLPDKSRMVVLTKESLFNDIITNNRDQVFKFIEWHMESNFGLKFLLLDNVFDSSDIGKFSNELREYTMSSTAQCIDDFILYNSECVFGRVDPTPGFNNGLSIRLILNTTSQRPQINGYKIFFEKYWIKKGVVSFGELYNEIYNSGDKLTLDSYNKVLKKVNLISTSAEC